MAKSKVKNTNKSSNIINEFDRALINGDKEFLNKNYINAREWYVIALNGNKEQKTKATCGIINVYINIGNFKALRETLNYVSSKSNDFIEYFGDLELYEYNFDRALDYYSRSSNKIKILFRVGIINIQKGNYNDAIKTFQILSSIKNDKMVKSRFLTRYIGLLIYLGDIEQANYLFNKINMEEIIGFDRYVDKNINFLGQILKNKLNIDKNGETYFERIINGDVNYDNLKKHVYYNHVGEKNAKEKSYFFNKTNLDSLINSTSSKIQDLNGIIECIRIIYKFLNDSPCGYLDGHLTNGVCCTTSLDSKNIINLYPFLPSDDFNKEGYIENKSLILKRKEGLKEVK